MTTTLGFQQRRRSPYRDEVAERGFILVAVTLLVTSILIIALIAFGSVGFLESTTTHVNASGAADSAANAGIAAAVNDVAAGNEVCNLSARNGGDLTTAPHAGSDSYTVSISYYANYVDPEVSTYQGQPNLLSCPLTAATFGAILVTSTGTSQQGALNSSETVTELLAASVVNPGYALFDANVNAANPVSLNNLSLNQVTGGLANPGPGNVFADGSISGPSSGGCQMFGTFVATGSVSMQDNCTVGGSIVANTGVTLSQASVEGNVTAANGNVVMSNSTVEGGATAIGNILLCPNPPGSSCTGLSGGKSTISGSATATGTITLGTTSEPYSSGGVTDSSSGDSITSGPVDPSATGVSSPLQSTTALPNVASPVNGGTSAQQTAYNAWKTLGYTVDAPTASCSGSSSTLYTEIANATGPTVVVGNCTSGGSPTPLSLTGEPNLTLKNSLAVFSADGFTLGGGFAFKSSASSAIELSLVVPTPASSYSCSTTGEDNITVNSNDLPPGSGGNPVYTNFFTPCFLNVATGLNNIYGEAYVGALNLTKQLQLFYESFAIPGLDFGYSLTPTERYVTGASLNPSAPAVTSANSTTFNVGSAGSFPATASGSPASTFSDSSFSGCTASTLPSGVTFNSSGLLSGSPASGTAGTYTLCIQASNGVGATATQTFHLTVANSPPTLTQVTEFVQDNGPANSSFTTSNFTMLSSDDYVILVSRTPDSGDSISGITSSGFSTSPTFTSVATASYNASADPVWAYYATGGSGTGAININFQNAQTNNEDTYIEIVQIGNPGSPPVSSSNIGWTTGSGTTASAALPSTPGANDGEIVFFSTNADAGGSPPTSSPSGLSNLDYDHHPHGSIGTYCTSSGSTTTYGFTIGPSQPWGGLALDIA